MKLVVNRTWLTKIRNKNMLTQSEVAQRATIDRSFYSQIESGIRNPSVETAQKIADVLKFKWTLFFENDCCEKKQ